MIKGRWTKAVWAGLAMLMIAGQAYAAPKKKAKKDDPYKKLEKRKDPDTKKVYNLKGIDIVIADWWSNPDREPSSSAEEDQRAFRNWLQKTYNFTMVQKSIGGWGTHPTTVANFCTTGGDENYIFIVDGRSIGAGLKANLFYDLSSIKAVNWSDKKWDQVTKVKSSKGLHFYGMRAEAPEPRGGVFFNKRLLQEANIDPDYIYDLQKEGKWTWETFEDICRKITRDTDNDGVPDIYAMSSLSTEFSHLALMSNGGAWIARDKNGKLYNDTNSENSMEALNWIRHMVQNYELPSPEGANWDYMYTEFANGNVAFLVDQEYNAQPGGRFSEMKDDFGFVCFPLGPKGDGKYKTLHDDSMYVIPACYDKDRAESLAKAYDLWSDTVPGYEGQETWKESYYACFRDTRVVDETLTLMHDNPNPRFDTLVAGFDVGSFVWNFWAGAATAQEQYETTKNAWQALIDDANR